MIVGCSSVVPSRYLQRAVPHATLTSITSSLSTYQGRMVVLGGTIVGEAMRGNQRWLHIRNRPLDEDYQPQLPPSPDDPEGGEYWAVIDANHSLPTSYHQWADMILAGYVMGLTPTKELALKMVYARGRTLDLDSHSVWEHPEYITFVPSSVFMEVLWE